MSPIINTVTAMDLSLSLLTLLFLWVLYNLTVCIRLRHEQKCGNGAAFTNGGKIMMQVILSRY